MGERPGPATVLSAALPLMRLHLDPISLFQHNARRSGMGPGFWMRQRAREQAWAYSLVVLFQKALWWFAVH
jgi:hypothetical protein